LKTKDTKALAYPNQIHEVEAISFDKIAASQWMLIEALEREYLGRKILNTHCIYEDENWFDVTGAQGSRTGIHWQVFSKNPAIKVLLKTMIWDQIFGQSIEISTAKLRISLFVKTFMPLIKSRKLLSGKYGEVLIGLNHIRDNDLIIILDQEMLQAPNEAHFYNFCHRLNRFIINTCHYEEKVPFFQITAKLPWIKSGETVTSWIKRRASDLKFVFPRSEGFEPLSAEATQPLVEISFSLIDDYYLHFLEIGPVIADYTTQQNNTGDYVRSLDPKFVIGLLDKYGPLLGHIVPPPNLNKKKTFSSKGRAIFLWLRALVKLCRAACLNIILLTSGLRNFDLRNLKVGSCKPSGRVDILFYLRAEIQKTRNVVILPVPPQTDKAIHILEKLKLTNSPYLIDWGRPSKKGFRFEDEIEADDDSYLKNGAQLNDQLAIFAKHFHIPFIDNKGNTYTAHNYRTTVAGWLGSSSNLSLLLVRRLFGHSNNVMPTIYLNNNPGFVAEREAQKELANAETARQMALAASQGRLAGVKGEQLERGYQSHKSLMDANSKRSNSLTDAEIMLSFASILEQRISGDSMCGFLTPFGVICGRNPTDSSQPPCAKRSHKDKTKDIPIEILKHISDIDPQQCIGTGCTEAVLGPWSTAILDTVIWYRKLLSHQLGTVFTEEHFIVSAKHFIKQYETPIKKVFGPEALENDLDQPRDDNV
jgi:hypothetical protein